MGGTRFIMAGSFIDGSGIAIRRNVFLAVKDGIIDAIGACADLDRNVRAAIADFSHCTIVPALVDCSVSLFRSPSVDSKVRLAAEKAGSPEKMGLLEKHIRYCHDHGVLGVAVSDKSGLVERYQEQLVQKTMIDIRRSGRLCRNRQDYTVYNPTGGDFLRIDYSGDVEDEAPHYSRLNQKDLKRVLEKRGVKKAVVVANGRQHVEEALAAGSDAIEQGYNMGVANLKKMAERKVLWIPNVLRAKNSLDGASGGGNVSCRFSMRYLAPGETKPIAKAYWKKMLAEQLNQLRLAKQLGVIAAIGTGAGSVGILHGEAMVEEMKLFIKAGYSLEEVIQSASDIGARFFGMENLGALTVGRKATFLITRGGVKQLPRKLSYLEGIYVEGEPSNIYNKNPVMKAG